MTRDLQIAVPPTVKQPTFRFKIDNGAIFTVQAGKCSPPKRVSVGNHTVTEVNDDDYELDPDAPGSGITVFPADREVSKSLATRTITVAVPYGPNGETLVTFYNRIKLGMVKVCKQIPIGSTDALGTKPFSYDVYVQMPGAPGYIKFTLGPILPGECTNFSYPFPILNADGTPRAIGVHEVGTPSATCDVTSITVTGSRGLCDTSNSTTVVCPYPPREQPEPRERRHRLLPGSRDERRDLHQQRQRIPKPLVQG